MVKIFKFLVLVLASMTALAQIEVNEVQSQHQYLSHFFGHVPVNGFSAASFSITNRGNEPITFNRFSLLGGSSFSANSNCPRTLAPYQGCSVSVYFRPWYAGYHSADLVMEFSDNNNIYIRLWGYGENPPF
ncbi:MAG: choice-of-anchor D domain-containing protein [Bdellovibrionaceae bacterium]|nr:choice-of-anchor D domain-containing protein [Pseudobdellovibrionaceae bacterium]